MMRTLLVTALLLSLALAGCSQSEPNPSGGIAGTSGAILLTAPANPPMGTTWNHETSGAVTASSSSTLEAEETRNGHDALRFQSTIESSGTTTSNVAWNRATDRAVIEAVTTTSAPSVGTIETTTSYDPPCVRLQYPVRAGDNYEVTCSGRVSSSYGSQDITTTTQVDVLGVETITVQAGTFETVHVVFSHDGAQTHEYFDVNGCGSVLSTTDQGGEVRVELVSTTC
ncbi:MAG: hypothetical protein ACPHID_03415 [Thermoplasmatota archaeon]